MSAFYLMCLSVLICGECASLHCTVRLCVLEMEILVMGVRWPECVSLPLLT